MIKEIFKIISLKQKITSKNQIKLGRLNENIFTFIVKLSTIQLLKRNNEISFSMSSDYYYY